MKWIVKILSEVYTNLAIILISVVLGVKQNVILNFVDNLRASPRTRIGEVPGDALK